jgi:hypothetical protein
MPSDASRVRVSRVNTPRRQQNTTAPSLSHTPQVNFLHPERMSSQDLLTLQRTAGNQAVAGLLGVQAKLEVGAVDDPLEHEADRIAEQVTARPVEKAAPTVESHDPLDGRFAPSSQVEHEITASQSGGQPLPADLREDMETRFGTDFQGVRLHTGEPASRLSRQIGAKGFTQGQHIFMAQGRYDPASGEGRRLLAHELAHTVQQGGSSGAQSQKVQRGRGKHSSDHDLYKQFKKENRKASALASGLATPHKRPAAPAVDPLDLRPASYFSSDKYGTDWDDSPAGRNRQAMDAVSKMSMDE